MSSADPEPDKFDEARPRAGAETGLNWDFLLPVIEVALLFAALFCALPELPSNQIEYLPVLPMGAAAVILFAGSRITRWRRRYPIAIFETAMFATFVWALNGIANILYSG